MAEDLYPSPGVYGVPFTTRPIIVTNEANFMLIVILSPRTYKWNILNVDGKWRDSYEGKKLLRDYYTIQYSLDSINIVGSITYYLNEDRVINITCE